MLAKYKSEVPQIVADLQRLGRESLSWEGNRRGSGAAALLGTIAKVAAAAVAVAGGCHPPQRLNARPFPRG